MSVEVGVSIDDDLYLKVKEAATEDGLTVSGLIEQALIRHIGSRIDEEAKSFADSTWGIIPVDRETVEAVLREPSNLDV